MNLNSRIFDRIRTRPAAEQVLQPEMPRCNHPGCVGPGLYRAPMGRHREGQYFSFCLDHVRAYNASYNYFAGMSDEAVARYQRDATVGHRPTWSMGTVGAGHRHRHRDGSIDPEVFEDPLGVFTGRAHQRPAEAAKAPRYPPQAMKALGALSLDDTADAAAIKARYKLLVKRLHPDANGGDRSSEDKLREIIHAYNYLRSAKLA
jgi:hypothetical protein